MVNMTYGCRKLVLTELNQDGTIKDGGLVAVCDTPQEVAFDPQIMEGTKTDLRGGDSLLGSVQEEDRLVGMNATFRDALLSYDVMQLLGGGVSAPRPAVAAQLVTGAAEDNNGILWRAKAAGAAGNAISVRIVDGVSLGVSVVGNAITVTADTSSDTASDVIAAVNADVDASALVVASHVGGSTGAGFVAEAEPARYLTGGADAAVGATGYAAPTLGDQRGARPPFKAEVYTTEYEQGAQMDSAIAGYKRVTLWYCKGRVPGFTLADRGFLVPSYTIKSTENPGLDKGPFSIEDIAALP